METRDRRDDDIKGNIPCSGILGGRRFFDLVSSSKLEEFAKLEAALGDDGIVFFLAGVEISEICLGLGFRCKFCQRTEDLPACNSADVDIVSEYGGVCRGYWEWHFGEGRIK